MFVNYFFAQKQKTEAAKKAKAMRPSTAEAGQTKRQKQSKASKPVASEDAASSLVAASAAPVASAAATSTSASLAAVASGDQKSSATRRKKRRAQAFGELIVGVCVCGWFMGSRVALFKLHAPSVLSSVCVSVCFAVSFSVRSDAGAVGPHIRFLMHAPRLKLVISADTSVF